MRKGLLFLQVFIFVFGLSSVGAQNASVSSPLLDSYLRNFARANLSTKLQILQDAAKVDLKGMGPLYIKAVEFILDNQDLIRTDPMAQQLSILAVGLTGQSGYGEGKYKLWDLFRVDENTSVRVAVMNTLGQIVGDDKEMTEKLSTWLTGQNSLFLTGSRPDRQVVAEGVAAMGKIGAADFFPVLFTAMAVGYSNEISEKAKTALVSIKGNLKDNLVGVILKNSLNEKVLAVRMMLESDKLTDEDKGEAAEVALSTALNASSRNDDETSLIRTLRMEAAKALTARNWSKASPNAVRHFNESILEYEKGFVSKNYFLETIAFLGAVRTIEAAERLNLYLGLLNSYVENGQKVDDQIALAVITNLGLLGDAVASDNLLYVGYLDYGSTIKKAAREAFNNLKFR